MKIFATNVINDVAVIACFIDFDLDFYPRDRFDI